MLLCKICLHAVCHQPTAGVSKLFATGPHKVLHKSWRAGLTKCDCFDIVYVTYTRPNQKMLRKYIVWLRGTDEMAPRAEFGPRPWFGDPWPIT